MLEELLTENTWLIANVALLLFLTLLAITLYSSAYREKTRNPVNDLWVGLFFGFSLLASLLLAFEISDGVLTDLRTVPALLSGIIGGPVVAIVTVFIGSVGRWAMGGIGWLSGVFNILIPALIGILIWRQSKTANRTVLRFDQIIGSVLLCGALAVPVGLMFIPPTRSWDPSTWLQFAGIPSLANAVSIGAIVWGIKLFERLLVKNALLHKSLQKRQLALSAANESLDSTNLQLQLTLHASQLGLWEWAPNSGALRVDDRWCQIVGVDRDKILPIFDSWIDRVHPDDRVNCINALQEHLAAKTGYYENIYRMKHADGHWVTVKDTGTVHDSTYQAGISIFTGSIQDISTLVEERDHAKSALEQLNLIASAGRVGLFTHLIKSDRLECNQTFRDIFYLPESQYPKLGIADMDSRYHPDYVDEYITERSIARIGANRVRQKRVLKLPDGTRKHIIINGLLERDGDQVVKVIGSVVDETEAVLRQQSLTDLLKEKEALLRLAQVELDREQLAIELGFGYTWEFDLDKMKIKPDRTFAKWFGRHWEAGGWYPAEELMLAIPENWRARVGAMMHSGREAALADPDTYVLNVQHPILRADTGKLVWIKVLGKVSIIDGQRLFVGQSIDISDVYEQREKLLYQARHCPVTDLPNREKCLEILNRTNELQVYDGLAILKVGVNRFRHLNNVFGSEFGDCMLLGVREELNACLRPTDKLFRGSGGTFIVVAELIRSKEDLLDLCLSIIKKFENPQMFEMVYSTNTVSVGGVLVEDINGNPERWLQNAQIALSKAKLNTRKPYCIFEAEMARKLDQSVNLSEEMGRALENREFELYYQPQFSTLSQEIVGAEALIRWNHPERGLVSPVEFIPIAEETGAIVDISRWVLREACTQAKRWQSEGLVDFKIAINLSAIHFNAGCVDEDVQDALADSKLAPEYLELELTESATSDSVDELVQLMHKWSEQGVKIAIDDFGTGYSNLSQLSEMPINKLKIDQSFVRRLTKSKRQRALVETMILMAKSLDMRVIAEGVEDSSTAEHLNEMGCSLIQGYWIGKPMPAEAFAELAHSFDFHELAER